MGFEFLTGRKMKLVCRRHLEKCKCVSSDLWQCHLTCLQSCYLFFLLTEGILFLNSPSTPSKKFICGGVPSVCLSVSQQYGTCRRLSMVTYYIVSMYVKLCTYAIHTWLWGTRSRRAKVIQLRDGALTSSRQHQQFFCDVDGIDFDKSSLHKGNGCHQNCRPKMETLKCNVSLRVRAWLHCLKSHKQTSTQKKKKVPLLPIRVQRGPK